MFDIETTIMMLRNRKRLLLTRDPVANEKIAKKIERRIRALEKKNT